MERIGYTALTPTLEGYVAHAGQVVLEGGGLTTAFGTPLEVYQAVPPMPAHEHEAKVDSAPEASPPASGHPAAEAPPPVASPILQEARPYPYSTTPLTAGSIGQGEHAVEAFHGLFLPDPEVEMLEQTSPDFAVVTAVTATEDSQRKGRSRRYRRFNGAFDHKLTLEELLEILGGEEAASKLTRHPADDESWHSTFHVVSGSNIQRLPATVVRMLARSLNASSLLTGGLLSTAAIKLAQRRNTGVNSTRAGGRGGRVERRRSGSKSPRAILFSRREW